MMAMSQDAGTGLHPAPRHATICPMGVRRCSACGEARLSLFVRTKDARAECASCGGEMVTERRLPGRDRRRGLPPDEQPDQRREEVDRRDAPAATP